MDGGVVQSFISQGPTVLNISSCKKKKKNKKIKSWTNYRIISFLVANVISYVILANTMVFMKSAFLFSNSNGNFVIRFEV